MPPSKLFTPTVIFFRRADARTHPRPLPCREGNSYFFNSFASVFAVALP